VPNRVRRDHVFINCPFDRGYRAILDGIVFAIYDLGFVARCALEDDDGGEIRLSKIERIIEECKFGIHDLSAVAIDPATNLPRFNMPLELGLFLGCKRFGAIQYSTGNDPEFPELANEQPKRDFHKHQVGCGRPLLLKEVA
jgi:hypothetical protein